MFDRPFVLTATSLPSSQEWVPDSTRWGFVTIRDGYGYLLTAGKTESLGIGDAVIIPPGTTARLLASQLRDLQISVFTASPSEMGALITLEERRQLEQLVPLSSPATRLPAEHPWSRDLANKTGLPHQPALAERTGLVALTAKYWSSLMSAPGAVVPEPEAASGRFDQVVRSMSAEELAARKVDDLCRACGCSERHLSRLFRQRFGQSLREFQIEHRLLKARDLLKDSRTKIIDVALESGFRHLGLFNSMFKRRFGHTPSDWRSRQTPKTPRSRIILTSRVPKAASKTLNLIWAFAFLWMSICAENRPPSPAPVTNNVAAPTATNRPAATFELRSFQVEGNSLLTQEVLDEVFRPYLTNRATLDTLRSALTALQLTYRGRGWVTVSPTLPPQQLTNGIVRVVVTEGLLTDIQVAGNRYFSSNNVLSALPSLKTNIFLNSAWFQTELDRANESRDRQIYPVIGPGPDPGTTALTLKVKDRLPLHGKFEVNNKGTISTPPLRIDASMQYNNLWQADHQIGIQYNFSPQEMKAESQLPKFYNQPLDAAYSGFYRLPLMKTQALMDQPEFVGTDFGYDPVTRRFRAPPATGRPELIVYASGSSQDTGVAAGPLETVADTPLVRIQSQATGQDLTVNRALGARAQSSLPVWGKLRSSLSFGPDWKDYETDSYNTNTFYSRIILTNNNVPVIIERVTAFSQPVRSTGITYLPLTLGWSGNFTDKWGFTSFSLSQGLNVANLSSYFTVGSNRADGVLNPGHYYVLNPSINREQKISGEWAASIRANGQWADRDLIDNEQYVLGGTQGVRGYKEGEESHTSGWRVQVEPHTPWFNLGPIDGTELMRAKFSAFTDFGQGHFHQDLPQPDFLWGAGVGTTVTVSDWLEGRLQMAWALQDSPATPAGTFNVYFSVALQF